MKRDKNRRIRQLLLKDTEPKEKASQEEIDMGASLKDLLGNWKKDMKKNE